MLKENVKKYLKSAGITQNELATRLNVSRQTLHYYLNGNITLSTLAEIALSLGVSPWELLRPDEETPPKPQPRETAGFCPYCGQPFKILLSPDSDQGDK